MKLNIDVTPIWWRYEANTPETFADWCVKAVRAILAVWPTAEVRLSREKLVAVVSFGGEQLVRHVDADKRRVRMRLASIVLESDRSSSALPVEPDHESPIVGAHGAT